MVAESDFVRAGGAVVLKESGRRGFMRAYEGRMDTLVTHPLFEYRGSYRRMLEIQSRRLGRGLEGEIGEDPVFTTRAGARTAGWRRKGVGRGRGVKGCRGVTLAVVPALRRAIRAGSWSRRY